MHLKFTRIFVVLCLFLGFSDVTFAENHLLTETEFRDRVISKIKDADDNKCFKLLEPSYFTMSDKGEGCEDQFISTFNTYNNYSASPEDLDFFVDRFVKVAVFAEEQEDADIVKSQLAVILRHKDYLEAIQLGVEQGQTFYHKPYAGDLLAILAVNYPESLAMASSDQLEHLNLNEEQLWKAAEHNLKTIYNDMIIELIDGVSVYDAESGLATGHLWNRTCDETDYFAFVVDRNVYLFAEASNEKGLQTLLQAAAGMVFEQSALSDNVVSCEVGTLEAYELSDDGWIPVLGL